MAIPMRQRIIDTLEMRGGTVINMRGYAAFIHLAQHMGYGMKGARDQKALQDVVTECRRMEEEGLIVVDWAPTTRDNIPRAGCIALVEPEEVIEVDLTYLAGLSESELRALVGRLENQNAYLNERHDTDKAAIASLERDVEQGRDVVSRLRDDLSEANRAIRASEATIGELQAQLRAIPRVKSGSEPAELAPDDQEVYDQKVALRNAERELRTLRRRRDELETLVGSLQADIAVYQVIKTCHDQLHRELSLPQAEHIATSLGGRVASRAERRARRNGR